MIDPPKKWAYLVAIGPLAIVSSLLAVALAAAGLPAMELVILALMLNILSLPLVLVGIWFDTTVVESQTGIEQRRLIWSIFTLLFAPITGTVYLWSRKSHFDNPTNTMTT